MLDVFAKGLLLSFFIQASENGGPLPSQSSKSVLGDVTSSVEKSITTQPQVAEQGVSPPPDSSYSYDYPG